MSVHCLQTLLAEKQQVRNFSQVSNYYFTPVINEHKTILLFLLISQNRPGTDYYDRNCNPLFSPSFDLDDSANNLSFSRIGNRPLLAQGAYLKCDSFSTKLLHLSFLKTVFKPAHAGFFQKVTFSRSITYFNYNVLIRWFHFQNSLSRVNKVTKLLQNSQIPDL